MDDDTNNYEITNNDDYQTPTGYTPEDSNLTPTPVLEFAESLDSTPTPNVLGTGVVEMVFPDDPTPSPFLNTPTGTFDGALLTPTPNTGFADTEDDTPKPVGIAEVEMMFPDDPTPTPFLKTPTPLSTPTSNDGFADTEDDTPNPLGTAEVDFVSEDDPTPTPFLNTPTGTFDGALLTPTPTSGDFASSDDTPTSEEFLGTAEVDSVSADDPTPTPFLKTPTSSFDGALLTPTSNTGFADTEDDFTSTPSPTSSIPFFALVDSGDGEEFDFYYDTPTPTDGNFAPIEITPYAMEEQPTPPPNIIMNVDIAPQSTPSSIGNFADDNTTPSSLNLNEGTINDMDSQDLDYSTPTPVSGFVDVPDMGDSQASETPTPVNGFADDGDVFDPDQIDVPDMGDAVSSETPTPVNGFADDGDVFDPDQLDVPDMEDMPNVVYPTPSSDEGFADNGDNFFDSDMGDVGYDATPTSDGFADSNDETPSSLFYDLGDDTNYETPSSAGFADGGNDNIDIPNMDDYSTPLSDDSADDFADDSVDPTPTAIFYDLDDGDYATPSSAGFADGDDADYSDIDIPNMDQTTPTPQDGFADDDTMQTPTSQDGFADDSMNPTPTSYVDPAPSVDLPTPTSQDGFADDGISVTPSSSYVDPFPTPTYQDGFADDDTMQTPTSQDGFAGDLDDDETMYTPTSQDGFADSMTTPTMELISANAPVPGMFFNETTPTSEEDGFSDDGDYSPTSLFADDGGLGEDNPTPTSYSDVAFAPVPGGFSEVGDADTSYPTPTSDSGFMDSSDDVPQDVTEDASDPMTNTTPSSTIGNGFMDGFDTQTPIPMDVTQDYTEGSENTGNGSTPTSTSEDTFADDDGSNSWVEEMYAGEDATPTSSVPCPSDVRTCPDGSVINRSPLAECEFIPCGFNNNEFIDNHILWSKSEPSHYTYNMRWTGQLASNEAYLTEERKVTVVNGRMTKAETVSTGEFFVDVNTNEDLVIPYLSLLEWFFWAGGQIERNPYVLNFEFDPKGFINNVFCDETMGQADEYGFVVTDYVELDPVDDDSFADSGSTTPTPNVNDGLLDNPPSTPDATLDSGSISETPTPYY